MEKLELSNALSEMKEKNLQSLLIIDNIESVKSAFIELLMLINSVSKGLVINFRAPSISTKQELSSKNVDIEKVFFIDGVCVSADEMPDDDKIDYLMNQKDLDGIIVNLDSVFIKRGSLDYIIIDLLDALLIYNSIESIKKMIDDINKYASNHKISVIVFMSDRNKSLINEASLKFSKVIGVKVD